MRAIINNLIVSLLAVPSFKDGVRKCIDHLCGQGVTVKILDIGGGGGKLWEGLKCSCLHLTIIDPWVPDSRDKDVADFRIEETFQNSSSRLNDDVFDLVLAMDVLEHLPSEQGYLLLYEMIRLSKGQVAIYTPNGFVWQPPSKNNQFNAHVSGWSVKDLKAFGFTSFKGHVGHRALWGAYSEPKYAFTSKSMVVASVFGNLIINLLPSQAHAFSAWVSSDKFPPAADQSC
jgi:2-polyprenyl-3-methyl-5-hydroxy-6-metoxy-1,4-benzoquinol methylase